MKTKLKTKVIIVRGCKFRVLASEADQHIEHERKLIRDEWRSNNLID